MSIYPVAPSQFPKAVTKSDTADIYDGKLSKGIYCGSGGNITVVLGDDSTVLFVGTIAGSIIPIQIKRVNSSGTTPTDIVALY